MHYDVKTTIGLDWAAQHVTAASQPASQSAGRGLLCMIKTTDPLPGVTHRSKSMGLSAPIFGKMSLFS